MESIWAIYIQTANFLTKDLFGSISLMEIVLPILGFMLVFSSAIANIIDGRTDNNMEDYISLNRRFDVSKYFLWAITIIALAFVILEFGGKLAITETKFSSSLLVAVLILILTVMCIVLAIRYAPRKLFVSMGAAIAFIFTAYLYEGYIWIVDLIESTGIS